MAKHKYRFNPESLSFDKIEHSIRKQILRFFPLLGSSIIMAFILYFFVFGYLLDSPKERKLKNENSQLLTQYELLQKRLDQIDNVLNDIQYRDDNLYRVLFEAEPINSSIRNAGFGGANRYEELEGYDNSQIIIETSKKLDKITKKLYIQSKSYDEVIELAKNKEERLVCIPAIQPILNKELTRVSSYFGTRFDPVYKGTKKHHDGIDFTAPVGTPIYSTGNGVVEEVIFSGRGYGNHIVINHGFGYKTLYAHLSRTKVWQGQKIKRGELIGEVGNTGKSVGPHLHYEVHRNGRPIDPINYFYMDLTPNEYDSMIEFASQEGGQTLD